MITSIECVRKWLKWYRKFFLHLLDITVLNSHTLFNAKTGKSITVSLAVKEDVLQMVTNHSNLQNDIFHLLYHQHQRKCILTGIVMCVQTPQLKREEDMRAGTCVPNAVWAYVYTPASKNFIHYQNLEGS
jgi:hypothetical protein